MEAPLSRGFEELFAVSRRLVSLSFEGAWEKERFEVRLKFYFHRSINSWWRRWKSRLKVHERVVVDDFENDLLSELFLWALIEAFLWA